MKRYVDPETVKKFVKETLGIDGLALQAFNRWIDTIPARAVKEPNEPLTVGDLMSPKRYLFTDEVIVKSRVIAYDAGSGKQLFDTSNNKQSYIRKYMQYEIDSMWAGVKMVNFGGFSERCLPVIKMYLHKPEMEGENE